MESVFTGYNLNFSLGSNDSVVASMSKKWDTIDRAYNYYPNIISHYIEEKDNTVGRDAFLLFQNNQKATFLSYGIIKDKNKIPEITSTTPVTT
jgi:hypothetical protein